MSGQEWRVVQSETDPELYAVRGVYLVADKLPLEDARLIAAAPEMLVMLCQYADDLRYPPEGDSRERRLAAVQAMIAKATGK